MNETEKPKPKTTPKPRESRFVAVTDCTFANAIKVGQHQINYLNSKEYDIRLTGTILSIRMKSWKPNQKTVHTTLANVIYWR